MNYRASFYKDKNLTILHIPYIKKNHPDMNVVIDESPKNTKEEVLFIKKYMKDHAYKSALLVTDPPHSRRVSLLTSLVSVEGDERMSSPGYAAFINVPSVSSRVNPVLSFPL